MPTVPPSTGEPHARGSVIHGFRAALVDLWGDEALAALAARLPLDTRIATVDTLILPFEWVPLPHVIAWHDALWTGPCAADEHRLARLVARSIELGFGRFKSAFFTNVTPERLVSRAPELWRWQHTHGELTANVEGLTAVVTLRDHPYVEQPSSRRITAESYRYIVGMAGAREVRMAWGDRQAGPSSRARELVVQLSWLAAGPP
jgi:hypothetical protein